MCIGELSNKSCRVGGERFAPERRALMTRSDNARLDSRGEITAADLPRAAGKKGAMGFLQ